MTKTKFGKPLCRSIMAVAIMMLSLQAMAFSYTYQGKTLYYNRTSDNRVKVTYYDHYNNINYVSGDVVIPSTVTYNGTTYSVTSIGDNAFKDCSGLTSVSIPNSVTSIEWSAFYGCRGLTSVTLPNSVTYIEDSAFYDCSGLTSVTIPNSVTSIGGAAFSGCSGLTSVTIPNSVIYIGGWAFSFCSGLTSVTIPNSVTYIGDYAFSDCSGLTSLTIGTGVTSIGNRAFKDCSGLTTLNFNAIDCQDFEEYYDDYNNDYYYYYPFSGTSLTTVNIGDSVQRIPANFVRGCHGLTSVTIPNSVTSIGRNAFEDCSGLTSVTIGNSVTSIRWSAFSGCSGLTSVTIPNSVTSIGGAAFSGCSGLTSITIPTGVTYIEYSAFSDCSGLTSVSIPNSVTSIGIYAFYGCSGLTSVSIPNSVTSIGNYAFWGCSGLTSVTIPNSVTSIEGSAFSGCSGLTSVTIGTGVTSIGSYAFFDCSSLTSITIGNSLTSIGERAFYGCSGLTSVKCLASIPPSIGNNSFQNISATCTLTVPCGSLEAYTASDWNTYFASRISEDLSFELSVSANDEAYGRVEVETQSCEVATITATPNEGYEFTGWNDGNAENPRTVTITSDTTFMAIFAETETTPTITVTVNDATMGSASYTLDGNTAVLTATANEGYEFTAWNDGNTENPRTVSITSDTAFVAIFTEAVSTPTITVTVNNEAMGSASYTMDGNTAVLTATPNEGYEFTGWNDGNTENPRTVTVTSDTAFVAIFTANGSSSLQEVNARKFAIYPNPAKSFVTLEFETLQENTLLKILDINGRRVRTVDLKAGQETLRIDVSDLPKGVYTITIGNATKKLIVE